MTDPRELDVRSCSWIDRERVENTILLFLKEKLKRSFTGKTPWSYLVALGLAFTANTKPPDSLDDKEDPWTIKGTRFFRQYRAMMMWRWGRCLAGDKLDPGWTPPVLEGPGWEQWIDRLVPVLGRKLLENVNKKIDIESYLKLCQDKENATNLKSLAKKYSRGEKSENISSIKWNGWHPNSYLVKCMQCKENEEVLLNAVIKFRAGKTVNTMGILLGSKHHVPWVWCEHALVKKDSEYWLHMAGSKFPSHTLYVNGRKEGTLKSIEVKGTEEDEVLITGAEVEGKNDSERICSQNLNSDLNDEESTKPIDEHPYTVGAHACDSVLSLKVTEYIEKTSAGTGEKDATRIVSVGSEEIGRRSLSSASRKGRIRSEGKLAVTDPPKIVTEPSSGATWDGRGAIQIVEQQTGRICVGGNDVLCKSLEFVAVGCSDSSGGTCFGQGTITAPNARRARGKGEGILLADDEGSCKGTVMRNTGPPGRCECTVRLEVKD